MGIHGYGLCNLCFFSCCDSFSNDPAYRYGCVYTRSLSRVLRVQNGQRGRVWIHVGKFDAVSFYFLDDTLATLTLPTMSFTSRICENLVALSDITKSVFSHR